MRSLIFSLALSVLCTTPAYADVYKVNDWTVSNVRAKTLSGPYSDGISIPVAASCKMENWKNDYGIAIHAAASSDANVHFEIRKRRGYLELLNADGWWDLEGAVPTDVTVVLDAKEYPARYTRESMGNYLVLTPFYPHDAERFSGSGSTRDFLARRNEQDSERNLEVIEFMADARLIAYRSPKSGKQLAQFYIKGMREAFALLRRCMQGDGEF